MPDVKTMQAELDNARLEVRNLQVMQMKPGLSPEEREMYRVLERSARTSVKLGRRAIDYQRLRDLGLEGGRIEREARYGDVATEGRALGTAPQAGTVAPDGYQATPLGDRESAQRGRMNTGLAWLRSCAQQVRRMPAGIACLVAAVLATMTRLIEAAGRKP
jgi:hypothetical protein